MWWLFNQPKNEPVVEINPEEFKKFVIQEALFIEKMDKMLSEAFLYPNWLTGKTFWLVSEVFRESFEHLRENALYFMPKEVKE